MFAIAQITDLHIDKPGDRNARRLQAVLGALARYRPACIIATGDLTENGAPEQYEALAEIMHASPAPFHLALGNHDRRAAFLARFGAMTDPHGFVQYALNAGPARLIVCDTLEEGREGGGFCERRALWLSQRLAEDRTPTLLALHHPPVASHLDWMDGDAPSRAWTQRLADVLRGHDHVKLLMSGHLHRPFASAFAGAVAFTAPATAPQLRLDFEPLDKDRPDGRTLVQDEPPGFGLHIIGPQAITSHVVHVGEFASVGRFTAPLSA